MLLPCCALELTPDADLGLQTGNFAVEGLLPLPEGDGDGAFASDPVFLHSPCHWKASSPPTSPKRRGRDAMFPCCSPSHGPTV